MCMCMCMCLQYISVDLAAKSKSHKAWFPTHKMKRPYELDWEPLPQAKRYAKLFSFLHSLVVTDTQTQYQGKCDECPTVMAAD